jgi:protein-tyrosine phosphatase
MSEWGGAFGYTAQGLVSQGEEAGVGVKVIELQGVANVRDLGGTPVKGGRTVAPGLLYRGSALAGATEEDRRILFDDLGIRRVIDLRCGWEREAKPDVQVTGVENLHIPFYDLEIVGIEYTEPAEGTKTVGRDVACDPDRFYRSLSNELTVGQMRKGLHALFSCACRGVPVYQHCSGGKDRAGIMALLTLTVLGASSETVMDDYLFTNVSRDKNYDKMYARFLRLADGNEELARELVESHRARPENLDAFYWAIDEAYGSMDSFVREQLDFDDAEVVRIRECCTIAR